MASEESNEAKEYKKMVLLFCLNPHIRDRMTTEKRTGAQDCKSSQREE